MKNATGKARVAITLVLAIGAGLSGLYASRHYSVISLNSGGTSAATWAQSVNARNQALVLVQSFSGEYSGLVWQHDDLTPLGDLGNPGFVSPAGMNDRGQVAGQAHTEVPDTSRAFLSYDGRMSDLGTLGGNYSAAYGINNDGVVVGDSQTADLEFHAVVWQPASGRMTDIGTLGGVVRQRQGDQRAWPSGGHQLDSGRRIPRLPVGARHDARPWGPKRHASNRRS